jgi:hypothetical protein
MDTKKKQNAYKKNIAAKEAQTQTNRVAIQSPITDLLISYLAES